MQDSRDEAIEATAAAWIAQRDDGLTPEEAADFARWRAADPRHDEAVRRLEAAWTSLGQLHDYRPEARAHPDRNLLARPAGATVISFPTIAATAALAAALALVAAWWWWPRPATVGTESGVQVYSTTINGYQRVALPDGSVVELNASTELRPAYTPAVRRVRLVRGEAHFTVAKDAARPFVVEAGAVALRAVGTTFNVRMESDKVEVLVTEGRVAVAASEDRGLGSDNSPRSAGAEGGAFQVELGANERMVISVARIAAPAAPASVEKVTPGIIREALAWQGARLVFADTPLAEVVAQFNRHNLVQLELGDADLAVLPVGGSFRADNVEAFVRLITQSGEIAAARPETDRIVLRRFAEPPKPT
jgi:transmembrane sensor